MKKVLLIIILMVISINIYAAKDWNISGINEFELIYRKMTSEYENEFGDNNKINLMDKFQLQFSYKMLQLGLKFAAFKPKYNKFSLTTNDIHNEENDYYFEEYYGRLETDNFIVQAGTFEAVIGSGMILHGYYDEDMDTDSSFLGFYNSASFEKWQSQLFFGLMKKDEILYQNENEKDMVGAVDFEYDFTEKLSIASAFVFHNINLKLDEYTEEDYQKNLIFSGKTNYSSDIFDFSAEFAKSRNDNDIQGKAIYSHLTSYLGKFTLSAAYKNYRDFASKLSDLPTVNHSEEPLHATYTLGSDEEGLMGEIRFIPDIENEFIVNYAEGWTDDHSIRQSDFYAEYKHEFDFLIIKTEYGHLEQWKENKNWKKEISPVVSLDFIVKEFPIIVKAEYQFIDDVIGQNAQSHTEPKIQTDISYNNYSISGILETQNGDSSVAKDGDVWISFEVSVNILNNTDIRLFAGKEKAGKVCRNGVCKIQPEFEGIRLEISTSF